MEVYFGVLGEGDEVAHANQGFFAGADLVWGSFQEGSGAKPLYTETGQDCTVQDSFLESLEGKATGLR